MLKYTLSCLCFITLLASCQKTQTNAHTLDKTYCIDSEIQQDLQIQKVEVLPIIQSITLTGQIMYNQQKTVAYHSLIEGVIQQTYFSLGDFVNKDQTLALISSTDLNDLLQELESSTAEKQVIQRQLQTTKSLFEDGLASNTEFLEAQAEVEIIDSKIAALQKNLQRHNPSGKNHGAFEIKAPISGYIVENTITKGSSVSGSEDPLFTVADLSEVWVMANVYTANIQHVKKGQKVLVNTSAYPNEFFEAKIDNISQTLDSEQRVLKAQIIMDNQDYKLRPGMIADIIVELDSPSQKAVAIPNSAIVFDNNQNYIVVFNDRCNQEVRRIDPIARNSQFTYTNTGIEQGEQIITNNALLVYEQLNNPF
ncbi:efflux RND transporter periplasmic adaptor subunit [Myroides sp. LJL115]